MARELTEKEKLRFETFHTEIISRLGELRSLTERQEFTESEREDIFETLENIIEELDDLESALEEKDEK